MTRSPVPVSGTRCAAWLLLVLLILPAPARARVELVGGPEMLRRERWRSLVALLGNEAGTAAEATLQLHHRSGRVVQRTWLVPAFGALRQEEYLYCGHPDPVIEARLTLGHEQARWTRPDQIPPERVVLVASADPRWLARVAALVREPGVGVALIPPVGLPGRWMGLRGLAGLALDEAEWARRDAPVQEAIRRYVLHGGLLILMQEQGAAEIELPWVRGWDAVTYGRGRVVRLRPHQAEALALAPWPIPPRAAPALPLARLDASPPLRWLLLRFGGWFVFAVGVCFLLRRRPLLGVGLLLVGALTALLSPPEPDRRLTPREVAGWTEAVAGVDGPIAIRRTEVRLVPERSGRLEVGLPTEAAHALVGLQPGVGLALEWNPEPAGWLLGARWGEPLDLLVEADAGD